MLRPMDACQSRRILLNIIQLTGNHIDPNETVQGEHYKMLTSNKFTLSCVVPDHALKLRTDL